MARNEILIFDTNVWLKHKNDIEDYKKKIDLILSRNKNLFIPSITFLESRYIIKYQSTLTPVMRDVDKTLQEYYKLIRKECGDDITGKIIESVNKVPLNICKNYQIDNIFNQIHDTFKKIDNYQKIYKNINKTYEDIIDGKSLPKARDPSLGNAYEKKGFAINRHNDHKANERKKLQKLANTDKLPKVIFDKKPMLQIQNYLIKELDLVSEINEVSSAKMISSDDIQTYVRKMTDNAVEEYKKQYEKLADKKILLQTYRAKLRKDLELLNKYKKITYDRELFATAAYLASAYKKKKIVFVTFDNDFVCFKNHLKKFKVNIMSGNEYFVNIK